jgi:hypothetical protein
MHLVVPHAVEVAGVDQVDAGVDCGVNRRDALRAICRPVGAGHAHATEPEGGDLGSGRPESTGDHANITGGFDTPDASVLSDCERCLPAPGGQSRMAR